MAGNNSNGMGNPTKQTKAPKTTTRLNTKKGIYLAHILEIRAFDPENVYVRAYLIHEIGVAAGIEKKAKLRQASRSNHNHNVHDHDDEDDEMEQCEQQHDDDDDDDDGDDDDEDEADEAEDQEQIILDPSVAHPNEVVGTNEMVVFNAEAVVGQAVIRKVDGQEGWGGEGDGNRDEGGNEDGNKNVNEHEDGHENGHGCDGGDEEEDSEEDEYVWRWNLDIHTGKVADANLVEESE